MSLVCSLTMVVEIMRLQLSSGMKCFSTGWEMSFRLAIESASKIFFTSTMAKSSGEKQTSISLKRKMELLKAVDQNRRRKPKSV
ncbi:hypothetical protein TNCV_41901 [Trichonephila clavipes]|nr:hypothetical protein TNCV_41901 [Trichonephila clavipes]